MKEDISSQIIKITGPEQGTMIIQALKSCEVEDEIELLRKGINVPITSLKQLSVLNTHLEAIRSYAKNSNKSKYRTYPVKLNKQGTVFIDLFKTRDNSLFFSDLIDFILFR